MNVYSPSDKELIDQVKKAACQHFDIDEDTLVNGTKPAVANVRFLCFWIIHNNTTLKRYMIASFFGKSRGTVIYGIGLIDCHVKIYRQTFDDLRTIARIANTFEKKHQWHIQPISTTN